MTPKSLTPGSPGSRVAVPREPRGLALPGQPRRIGHAPFSRPGRLLPIKDRRVPFKPLSRVRATSPRGHIDERSRDPPTVNNR
ncbi:hypothetical protein BN13_1090004 [Nostocoides jenkinsii Ben 74]|uniref:Uncharacterized protein n=1 Tax=Nostocoides jenkinsii Ben 74 TaxID=1193518 RepID=A0A077M4U5_9MICO|nr:hypothetical protein BN13_1090004 [Tetrasphaera jenkinsii Ben 74]